jgi:hypothetical protein
MWLRSRKPLRQGLAEKSRTKIVVATCLAEFDEILTSQSGGSQSVRPFNLACPLNPAEGHFLTQFLQQTQILER